MVLAARVAPDDFRGILRPGLVLVVFLVVVVRPVVGWVCTIGCRLPRADRWFIGALAPRGIVAAATSSLFALQLDQSGHDDGRIEAIVFLVIVGTCLVYGLTCSPLARRLGVAQPEPRGVLLVGDQPWLLEFADALSDAGVDVLVLASGQYRLADASHPWSLATIPAVSERFPTLLETIGTAVIASLDDEHNAVAIGRCLDVLPRREVYVLPNDRAARTASDRRSPGDETARELDDEESEVAEVAAAQDWDRRPFSAGATQATVEAAYAVAGIRVARPDADGRVSGGLVLAVVTPDGRTHVEAQTRPLTPDDIVIACG